MKSSRWQPPGEHPDRNLILAHLEGELNESDSTDVAQHLRTCWDCRAYSEQIERAILAFVEYRNESFLPNLSPPPGRWNDFRFLLERAKVDAGNPSSAGRSLRFSPLAKALKEARRGLAFAVPRPAWISASISVVTALALLRFSVFEPPQMQAAEFLHKAATATLTSGRTGTVVSQRVRIRRGSAVFEQVTMRGAKVSVNPASKAVPDHSIKAAMALVDIDVQSPLSAERFADWRDAIRHKDDAIFESRGSVTLRTTPLRGEGETVRYASITVDRTQWRPIAEHVEFQDQPPLDITEISFEVRQFPSPREIHTAAGAAPRAVSESPLNVIGTELAVRSALHNIGADLGEPVEIRALSRSSKTVVLSGVVDSAERKRQLLAALKGIHNVAASLKTESEVASRELPASVRRAEPLIVTARSPIEKELLEHFSNPGAVEAFSKRAISLAGDLMTRAWALRHLSERYGSPGSKDEAQFNAASRRLLLAMRRDHYRAMAGSMSELTALLRPVLRPITLPVTESTDKLALFASTQKVQRLTLEVLSGTVSPNGKQTSDAPRAAGDLLAALRNLEITLGEQP